MIARPVAETRSCDLEPDSRGKPASAEYTPSRVPGVGLLVVRQHKLVSTYCVREVASGWPGRSFRLDKVGGGSDGESESYSVVVGRSPHEHDCPCKGFQRWRGRRLCKHLASVLALICLYQPEG